MEYVLKDSPMSWVLDPDLNELASGRKIPHLYDFETLQLCLFYPRSSKREWHPGKPIATSFMMWISDWLFHYETWLFTNEWEGGGIHLN
jgi:hypothetical protein